MEEAASSSQVESGTALKTNKPKEPIWKRHSFWILLITGFVVPLVMVVVPVGLYVSPLQWDERGQFGDQFGLVNAVFSGLALAGVIYAILLQREDLALQRQELEETREELRRAADAQDALVKSEEMARALMQQQSELMAEQSKALEETARLNAMSLIPAVACTIVRRRFSHGSHSELLIRNGGGVAFDLELLTLGHYEGASYFIAEEDQSQIEKANPCVMNTFHHAILPPNELLAINVPCIRYPNAVTEYYSARLEIFLQCRDAQGRNYCQLLHFKFDGIERHFLTGAYPPIPVKVDRIIANFQSSQREYPQWIAFFDVVDNPERHIHGPNLNHVL